MTGRNYQEIIESTHVRNPGHTKLEGGLHSQERLDMQNLTGYGPHFGAVAQGLEALVRDEKSRRTFVAVESGSLYLTRQMLFRPEFLVVHSEAEGNGEYSIQFEDKLAAKHAGRIAILQDVVTTGETALAIADALREVNVAGENTRLQLAGIWRRGELLPDAKDLNPVFLVEEPLDYSPAEDCEQCLTN